MIGIYKITSPTGRIYIGQSIDIERRFRFYKNLNCKRQPILYASLQKYGVDNHTFEIIEECIETLLNKRERYWQEHYNVLSGGLNCNLTETDEKVKRHSEETKNKIAKSNAGKKFSEQHKINLSNKKKTTTLGKDNNFYGKSHTTQFKQERSIKRSNGGNPKAKIVLNQETGVFYECAKEAAIAFNLNPHTLTSWLSSRYVNKTSLIYV